MVIRGEWQSNSASSQPAESIARRRRRWGFARYLAVRMVGALAPSLLQSFTGTGDAIPIPYAAYAGPTVTVIWTLWSTCNAMRRRQQPNHRDPRE
jgi:hypothetical protein